MDTMLLDTAHLSYNSIISNSSLSKIEFNIDSLKSSGSISIDEVLSRNSSVFVKSYGGSGISTFAIRGTSAQQNKVFWNNLDISSVSLALSDLSNIPLIAFDKAEVNYGFASLTQGSGGIGGSLSLSNKVLNTKGFEASYSSLYGQSGRSMNSMSLGYNFGRFQLELQGYYGLSKDIFEYTDITNEDLVRKSTPNANFIRSGYLSSMRYQLNSNSLLSMNIWHHTSERNLFQINSQETAIADRLKDDNLNSILEYQLYKDNYQLILNTGLSKGNNTFIDTQDSSSINKFTSFQNNLRVRIKPIKGLQIESGVSYKYEQVNSTEYADRRARNQLAVFIDATQKLNSKANVFIQIRQELIDDNLSPFIYTLGTNYKLNNRNSLSLSFSKNFRLPSLNDLYWNPGGNENLKAESSLNAEISYTHSLYKTSEYEQILRVNIFTSTIDHWIQWTPYQTFWQAENLKKVQNTGLEIQSSGHIKIGKYILANNVSYTYLRSEEIEYYSSNSSESGSNQLPYTPFQKATLGASLKRNQIEFRYNQSFTSRVFIDASNEYFMPNYSLIDLHLIWTKKLKNKFDFQLSLTLQNLLDKEYQVIAFRPQAGRLLSLNLTLNFGK